MYFERTPGKFQAMKIAMCEAQNWRCCYCKFIVKIVFGRSNEQNAATIEHIIPRAKGGGDEDKNLVIACNLCNVVRNHANPYRFERTIQKLLTVPAIYDAWHRFTPEQVSLLRLEIEFGALMEKMQKRNRGLYTSPIYKSMMHQRTAALKKLHQNKSLSR